MGQMIQNIQGMLKRNSQNIGIFTLRFLSGAVVGLTATLILQKILDYGNLIFWFVLFLCTALFLRSTKGWGFVGVLVLDFILVLIALILKMYILIAPGA